MPLDIPNVVAGTATSGSEPGAYGQSACKKYYDFTQQAKDVYQTTGKPEPLAAVANASIRYTPTGTTAKGRNTLEAVNNAIGYAKADIQKQDLDGDGAISRDELKTNFKQPFIDKIEHLTKLDAAVQADPTIAQARKAQVLTAIDNRCQDITTEANEAQVKAANFFAAVDVKDAQGSSDGKLTADEMAAKLLFDDAAVDMFNDHQESYQTIINGLEQKTDYTEHGGPSFETLKSQIDTIQQNPKDKQQPLAQDGQITVDERDIADHLVDAPIPTNQIISTIHSALDLKNRVSTPLPAASSQT